MQSESPVSVHSSHDRDAPTFVGHLEGMRLLLIPLMFAVLVVFAAIVLTAPIV